MSFQIGVVSYRRRRIALKGVLMCSSALLAAGSFSATALAQEVTELEGITVYSANRTPTDAAKVGSSVSVITEKELQSRSQTYLKDYLETVPGVNFVQSGPPGTTSSISMRGATARYVKVLVDGIDISDPSGPQNSVSFEHLLVGDVSRIEVLRGSQSTLYGGDAVAGVISIETKAAQKPGFSHSGSAEYGAFNTFRGDYTAGYAAQDGSNISFSVQGVTTDGFSTAAVGTEDDDYRNLTFSSRGEYMLSPTAKIFFAARSVDARIQTDSDYLFVGTWPNSMSILTDSDSVTETKQQAGRVGTEFSLLDGALQNTFAVQGMQLQRDIFSSGAPNGWYDGDRVKGEYKGVLQFNDQLSLLGGADWERSGAKNAGLSDRITADIGGVYAQLMAEPIDGLVLTGGGRIDDHSDFGRFETYRLTSAYLIPGTETKFRASYGTGFRAPSLDELYGSYGFAPNYGNPDLKPEESEGWDAGIEQGFAQGRYTLSATYFVLDTDNLITYQSSCGMVGFVCNANVPGVSHRNGVELAASAQVADGFVLNANYTYTEAEDATGARLMRVPKHAFVVGADLKPMDKVEVNITAKYVAGLLDNSYDVRGIVEMDDYLLVSAKASYEFMPGLKAYVRGENLLDEDYQTIVGYGTAGLAVYGGITMALPD